MITIRTLKQYTNLPKTVKSADASLIKPGLFDTQKYSPSSSIMADFTSRLPFCNTLYWCLYDLSTVKLRSSLFSLMRHWITGFGAPCDTQLNKVAEPNSTCLLDGTVVKFCVTKIIKQVQFQSIHSNYCTTWEDLLVLATCHFSKSFFSFPVTKEVKSFSESMRRRPEKQTKFVHSWLKNNRWMSLEKGEGKKEEGTSPRKMARGVAMQNRIFYSNFSHVLSGMFWFWWILRNIEWNKEI